jgi:TPP-dependent pyruvate/acetoin dehydrogenase alpha subunit
VTPENLIAFEKDIAAEFEAGRIKAPVHFAGGNERDLIDIFKGIRPQDWVLCQWRSHYHCLLKGVPSADVKAAILAGRSIALTFPSHRILASAIVGGVCPIATGLAWSIKRREGDERVHCFVGDMTAEAGIFHESVKYAARRRLPVHWWIEDNRLSVCTETLKAWGRGPGGLHLDRYDYKLTWPHVGTGTWVRF